MGTKMEWYIIPRERIGLYYAFQKVGGIKGGLFLMTFIGGLRLGQFLFVSLLPTMKGGRIWCRLLVLEVGGWFGIFSANMIRLYGMRGLILFMLSLFPHIIFYYLCIKEEWNLINSGISFREKYATINKWTPRARMNGLFRLFREFVQNEGNRILFKIMVLELLGIFTESFLNPILMEWMFVK